MVNGIRGPPIHILNGNRIVENIFKEMLYMMLKIDAYAIACYVRDVREQRFPQKSYKDMSMGQFNTKRVQKLVNKYQRNNVCVTVPFEGSSAITSKTDTMIFSYKENKFFGKTHEVSIGQINLILKDMPNSLIFFNNSKALVLLVESKDILKFDVLLGTSDSLIDLATFLKENNIYVEYFELIL